MLIRSVIFNIVLYVNFVVLGILFSPVLVLPQKWGWPVVRIWASSSLWWHRVICGIGEDIHGLLDSALFGCLVLHLGKPPPDALLVLWPLGGSKLGGAGFLSRTVPSLLFNSAEPRCMER